jgi:DNA repair exonuclease SbcCD ATPase subunit
MEDQNQSNLENQIHKVENNDITFDVENDNVTTDVKKETYKYTTIDCLEEDDPIPGQRFVLLSFVSPEGIMNCNIRGLKVRGVYDDYEKARRKADKLRENDIYHHVFVGEVGKWLPWDPNPSQIEEEEYENPELNKIMKKPHESEVRNQLNNLNELVGRHKEQLETKREQHTERQRDKIKQGVREFAKINENKEKEEEEQITRPKVDLKNLNRNAEATKERLRKKIEESMQRKQQTFAEKNAGKLHELEDKVKKMKEESQRLANKEHNVEVLKAQKKEIEENLKKMKKLAQEREKNN